MNAKQMQATYRFSNSSTSHHLAKLSKSALLELAALDEKETEEPADGKAVRGIEPNELATPSIKELCKRLRSAKEEAFAKDRLIASKNERLDTQPTPNDTNR